MSLWGIKDNLALTNSTYDISTGGVITLVTPAVKTFDGISAVNASTELITIASNPFVNGDYVEYKNPSGNSNILAAGPGKYYVVAVASNNLSLALTSGGAAIDLTDSDGSGNHSLEYVPADFTAAASLAEPGDTLIYDSGGTPILYVVKSITSATVLQLTDTSGVSSQSAKVAYIQQMPKHLTKTERLSIFGVDANVEMGVGTKTATFDGSSAVVVSFLKDTITLTAHGLYDGTAVVYSDGGGTAVGGLVTATTYYVSVVNVNTIKLYTTRPLAEAAAATGLKNLVTGGVGSSHTLITSDTFAVNQTQHSGWVKSVKGTGPVSAIVVTDGGSGYSAVPVVTVSGAATATATLTTGSVSSIAVTAGSSGYTAAATVSLAVPTAQTFDGISAVNATTELITIASNPFLDGDYVKYLNPSGNSDVGNLTAGAFYYVVSTAGNDFKLSLTSGGSAINLADSDGSGNHSLTGETSTAKATMGGRVGRISRETLVASGTLVATMGDAGKDEFVNS